MIVGETICDIIIVCAEERKVSRTSLIVGVWSDDPESVSLKIETHDFATDQTESSLVVVPLFELTNAVAAAGRLLRAHP